MAEIAIVNPRRHRRRKKASRRRRRTSHARRAAPNPRRRRRVARRRSYRRSARRNPRFGIGRSGITAGLQTGIGIAIGVVGANIGTGLVIKYVPGIPAQLTSGIGKSGLKLVVGTIALPMLLKAVKQPGLAKKVAIGAWASVILDLYATYVAPSLGLSDYEYVTGYQELGAENTPLGQLEMDNDGMGGGENMYADTMY